MADNNSGIPGVIQPGYDPNTNPLSVFREIMGTSMPTIPNGEPMTVPTALNVAGNFKTGPNPAAQAPNGTSTLLEQNLNFLNQADNWAVDKNAYGRSHFYGAGIYGANFERYYNHPKFKVLGFNPLRNNEAVYNQNSSWYDDFNRMLTSYGSLFGTGFKSMYDFGSKDTAKEYEKAMAIGMSSKGGVGGFFTNLTLNSAFTMGLLTEMIAENFAIAGLTYATGGLAAAPAIGAAIGKNAMGMRKLHQFRDALSGTKEMFNKLKDVGLAGGFYEKANAANFTNKVVDFINPFSRSKDYLDNLYSGKNGFDKLNDFAKTRKAFGAFYRDMREVNAVFSESLMEGEMSKNENNRDLINKYYKENGFMPEGEEAKKIYDTSNNIGFATALINAPAIYFSNKLVFDNVFRGFKPPSVVGKELIEGSERLMKKNADWKVGDTPFSFIERKSSQKVRDKILNSEYLPWSKKYAIGNLSEGLQESVQDMASNWATKYYETLYTDPAAAGLYNGLVAVGSALNQQFSAKGLETFLSGYLMGSMVQPLGAAFTSHKWAPALYNKYLKSEDYQKEVQRKQEQENELLNAVNYVLQDPRKLGNFEYNIERALEANKKVKALDEAQEKGDQKAFQDAKDELLYDYLYTAAEQGKMDMMLEPIDDLLQLDDNQLVEAFNEKKGSAQSIRSSLEASKQRAVAFQNTYDIYTEKYENPFNYWSVNREKNPEEYNYQRNNYYGFENARRDAIMANVLYEKTIDRMQSVYNDLGKTKLVKNASAFDFNVMLNSRLLAEEIITLTNEITVLKEGDAKQKKEAKLKEKKKEALVDFLNFSDDYQKTQNDSLKEFNDEKKNSIKFTPGSMVKTVKNGEEVTITEDLGDSVQVKTKIGGTKVLLKTDVLPYAIPVTDAMKEANENLYKVFNKYVNTIAQINNDTQVNKEAVDNAFIKVRDYFVLKNESFHIIKAINMLNDPEGFAQNARRNAIIYSFKRDNLPGYIRSSYKEFYEKNKDQNFLNEIFDLGLTIDPDSADKIVKDKNYDDIEFYYPDSGQKADEKDPKVVEAKKIIEKYKALAESVAKKETEILDELETEKSTLPKEVLPKSGITDKSKIYTNLVKLFRRKEKEKKDLGETTLGLETVADGDLWKNSVFQSWYDTDIQAQKIIADFKEEAPKEEVKEEIKELDFTPQAVPPGLEKLKGLYDKVVHLLSNNLNYVDKQGTLYDRVSDLKEEPKGISKLVLGRSAHRGNIIDSAIRFVIDNKLNTYEDFSGLIDYYNSEVKKAFQEGILPADYSVNFNDTAVKQMFDILINVKQQSEKLGYKFYSTIPSLYGKIEGLNLPQKGLIAGTIDLLAEKDGKFYIIDIKTSSRDRASEGGVDIYRKGDSIQLNAYRELIKQRTGVDIEGIMIFPVKVEARNNARDIVKITAPDFSPDNFINIEKKSLQELVPEKFAQVPAPAPAAPTAPVTTDAKAGIEKKLGIKLPNKNNTLPVSPKTWGDKKSLANQISSELKGVIERGVSIQEWLDKGYSRQLSTWTDETIIEFLEVVDIERRRQEELIETPRAYSDPTMGYTIEYLVENGIIEGPIVKPGTSTYLRIKEGIDKLNAEINAKYDELAALEEAKSVTPAEQKPVGENLQEKITETHRAFKEAALTDPFEAEALRNELEDLREQQRDEFLWEERGFLSTGTAPKAPAEKELTLQDIIDQAKKPKDYTILRDKLLDILRNNTELRNKFELTGEKVDEILRAKALELKMSITIDDLKPNTAAIKTDGTKVKIIGVNKKDKTFTIQSITGAAGETAGAKSTYPISQLDKVLKMVYKDNIDLVETPVTKVEPTSDKESNDSIKDLNDPAVKQQIVNDAISSKMTKEEAINNLKNKLCK